jgi:hypothetical protein
MAFLLSFPRKRGLLTDECLSIQGLSAALESWAIFGALKKGAGKQPSAEWPRCV